MWALTATWSAFALLASSLFSKAAAAGVSCIGQRSTCVSCISALNEACGDPFNTSVIKPHDSKDTRGAGIYEVSCYGVCVKWRYLSHLYGRTVIRRCCSSEIQLNIKVDLTCMHEAHTEDGELCMCQGYRCNAAPPSCHPATQLSATLLAAVFSSFLSFFFLHRIS